MSHPNKKIKEIKSINVNSYIYSLLLLFDGRFACGSSSFLIDIYTHDVTLETSLKGHRDWVISLCQLEDERLVSCSLDLSIRIWDVYTYSCLFKISSAHCEQINKVIVISENFFASSSQDGTIKLWSLDEPYRNRPIKSISWGYNNIISMLYIEEDNYLLFASCDSLCTWSLSTNQMINSIQGVECCSYNSVYRVDKDRVIIGGKISVHVVDFKKGIIVDSFVDRELSSVHSFAGVTKSTIMYSDYKGQFWLYDVDTKQREFMKSSHTSRVLDFLRIDIRS